jgi:hypothetical protein
MPQREQTRLRSSGRPGGSSLGCPQREQKRIGRGLPPPVGVHDRSMRMSAVTRGDQNTAFAGSLVPHEQCTNSSADPAQDRHRTALVTPVACTQEAMKERDGR